VQNAIVISPFASLYANLRCFATWIGTAGIHAALALLIRTRGRLKPVAQALVSAASRLVSRDASFGSSGRLLGGRQSVFRKSADTAA
jgi:hypothetical protein